jgi:hypothetical protein
MVSTPPATPSQSTGVGGESAGVGEGGHNMHTQDTGVASNDVPEGSDTDDETTMCWRDLTLMTRTIKWPERWMTAAMGRDNTASTCAIVNHETITTSTTRTICWLHLRSPWESCS